MRNMLAFFAALLLTVAGAGWYLGWYTVRSTPAPTGQRSVTFDINTAKIGDDVRAAGQKVQQRLAEKSQKKEEAAKERKPAGPEGTWFGAAEDLPIVEFGPRPRSAEPPGDQ